jgi:hypothetical protein
VVEADEIKLLPHAVMAVPRDDRGLHAAVLSLDQAFANTRQERSTRIQLSLSLPPARDDGFSINARSEQPFEM